MCFVASDPGLKRSMNQSEFKLPGAGSPRVLLTGTNRWAAPARIAIGLAKAGCEVSAICPTPAHPLLKTRVVRQTFPYGGPLSLDSLAAAIEATRPAIIIPCDDRGVRHLHNLHSRQCSEGNSGSEIAKLIERSLGAPESYPIVSSRYRFMQIADEEGIRVPPFSEIRAVDDFDSWSALQSFPWVLKADGTWGGGGVRFAETRRRAEKFFRELTRATRGWEMMKRLILNRDRVRNWAWRDRSQPSITVQSRIQGRPANCAVVCREGRVLAGIGVEVISALGLQGPAIVVRVVKNSDMMQAAKRIARRLELSGFFGLDFMIEDGTDLTYLIEMNPRCTPLSHLQLGTGRDMVGALHAQLVGQSFRATPSVTQSEMIAYFPQAWTSQSEFLRTSFQDLPEDEPELIEVLLHPWSERSLLGRAIDALRSVGKTDLPAQGYVFPAAVAALAASETSEV